MLQQTKATVSWMIMAAAIMITMILFTGINDTPKFKLNELGHCHWAATQRGPGRVACANDGDAKITPFVYKFYPYPNYPT